MHRKDDVGILGSVGELVEFAHQLSPLDHHARAILVVRRDQFSIEARKFAAKTLTGNDPTAHFWTFALEQPQIAILFDEHPPITRRHQGRLLAVVVPAPL
jgi:hypothetical protein